MFSFLLLIAVYVAAELGIAAWLVEFLQQTKAFTVARSSLYLSLFFGGLMLGRLLGSFVIERIGYLRTIITHQKQRWRELENQCHHEFLREGQ